MTFIDTAEGYRISEVLLGQALRGRRHRAFLATKVTGDHSPENMNRALTNSLRALGTDYIDLYQLHYPQPQHSIADTMATLVRFRDQGKIRYIGVSNFSTTAHTEACRHGAIDSSQPPYSMLLRGAEASILPFCRQAGIGVITHSTLAKGLLTGKYGMGHRFVPDDERSRMGAFAGKCFATALAVADRLKAWAAARQRTLSALAIAWVLAHPAVTAAIVGAKSPEQVRHNAEAADWELWPEDLAEIDTLLDGFGLDPALFKGPITAGR
jgi:aryl-alcohol dehydrogenase-like predicted oxidoreductase